MRDNGRIAVVTGASKGLGLEISRQLADAGVTVIVTARDAHKAEKATAEVADRGVAIPFKLEIGNPDDYAALRDFIEQRFGRIDILVNNAGVDGDTREARNTSSTASIDLLRSTFDTNFFEVVHVTQVLLPLIRKSEAGRIVNMAAILGSLTLQHQAPDMIKTFVYNSSKTALNAFTVHLADELSDTAIKVFSAHPGWVKTDHGSMAADLEVEEGARTPVALALDGSDKPSGSFIHQGEMLPW